MVDHDSPGPPAADAGELFDLNADQYEQAVDRSISFTGRDAGFFARRKVVLLEKLCRSQGLDLSQSTVLDVGCGTGTTDRHLVDHVRSLHGVDVSEGMLAEAKRNAPAAEFEGYDGRTLPFPAGRFDVTIAICVLHHVPEAEQAHFVRELNRVTRPNGLIVIFEHNPFNPLTRRAVSHCELDVGVTLLTANDIIQLLTGTGARVVGREYFLFTPLGGEVGPTLDRWLRWLPLGGQHAVAATSG